MSFSKYCFLRRHSHKIESDNDYNQIAPFERALVRKIEQKFGRLSWTCALGRIHSIGFNRNFTDSQWEMLGQYLRFSHLMVIQFENLTLSSIPSWLPSIPNLCGLRFFNVTFDSSPIRLFHCRNLDFLNIIKCGLKEVPDDLKMLSKLRSVNFEGNQIEKFPDVLFKLPALISIQLSGNPITKIPDSWASLPNLERLQLMECQITHFPEDLYRIPFVTLSSNPLEINNCERLDGVLWPKPWRFEEILAKIRRGQLLDELEILHPLFAKYRTQLLAQCEGIQNAAVNQICNTPVGIGAAAGHEILL